MVNRCKKCSDILKVTSGGGGEMWKMTSLQISNLTSANRCYFKSLTALFTSMEHRAKKLRFWKDGLLAEYRPKCPKVADFCYFCHEMSWHIMINDMVLSQISACVIKCHHVTLEDLMICDDFSWHFFIFLFAIITSSCLKS